MGWIGGDLFRPDRAAAGFVAPKRAHIRLVISQILNERARENHGKEKPVLRYVAIYGEAMTAWKVQKVIEKYGIYYRPAKNARTQAKRRKAEKRKRTTEPRNPGVGGTESNSAAASR
jgi:hypothetical protein